MRDNKIKDKMKLGHMAYGCQLAFPSEILVELMGKAGLDFVLLDGEHGVFGWESLDDMCRVADFAGVTPIARVPNIEASTILRYLDRGVMGILGPGIDNKEDAQQLVDACLYAPQGRRGLGGAPRAAGYEHFSDNNYIQNANSQMLIVAFLEHVEAIDNLEEILTVEGIDAYYVGPQDISMSLGFHGQPDHPKVHEITEHVRAAVEKSGRCYFGDVVRADRATNFFLSGIESFMRDNR